MACNPCMPHPFGSSIHIYIYIYIYVYLSLYIYIYIEREICMCIYIYRERERYVYVYVYHAASSRRRRLSAAAWLRGRLQGSSSTLPFSMYSGTSDVHCSLLLLCVCCVVCYYLLLCSVSFWFKLWHLSIRGLLLGGATCLTLLV